MRAMLCGAEWCGVGLSSEAHRGSCACATINVPPHALPFPAKAPMTPCSSRWHGRQHGTAPRRPALPRPSACARNGICTSPSQPARGPPYVPIAWAVCCCSEGGGREGAAAGAAGQVRLGRQAAELLGSEWLVVMVLLSARQ